MFFCKRLAPQSGSFFSLAKLQRSVNPVRRNMCLTPPVVVSFNNSQAIRRGASPASMRP